MSTHAHLWLGNANDPTPVYLEECSPEQVSEGTPWPAGAVLAVYHSGDRDPLARTWRPSTVDRWEFYSNDGWPLGFPDDCKVDSPSFRREFQVRASGWRTWSHGELERAARMEQRKPGYHARLNAQSRLIRSLISP